MKFKVRKEVTARGRKIVGFLEERWGVEENAEEKPEMRDGGARGKRVDDGTHLRDGAMAICLFYFSRPDPGFSLTRPTLLLRNITVG